MVKWPLKFPLGPTVVNAEQSVTICALFVSHSLHGKFKDCGGVLMLDEVSCSRTNHLF